MSFYGGRKLKQVYEKAQSHGYGLMANNFAEENVLLGFLEAYAEKESDLVVQISPGAAKFAGGGDKEAGLRILSYTARTLAECFPIGVAINLDHFTADEMDLIKVAIEDSLVSSIMIDASRESFEENVRITREVVEMANGNNTLIEAELGKIKGVEDEVVSDEAFYTDPDEAVDFVTQTGIDLLAISIGTEHGVSKGKDVKLQTDLARKIRDRLEKNGCLVPLVLHGASGLLGQQIKEIIRYGICKLNKDTHYQYVYARTAHDFYQEYAGAIVPPNTTANDVNTMFANSDWTPDKSRFDPRVVGRKVRTEIGGIARTLIEQAGSAGNRLESGGQHG